MSQTIWTRCAGSSELRPLRMMALRVVESQFINATRKWVDSDAEQAVLESLIEAVKPPVPDDPTFEGLHYLLFTPFRHPPLPHGSRFGSRHERGIWYGASALSTAFAEVAYYRLLFLEGTRADLGTVRVELSSFRIQIRARRGVDLTQPPFAQFTHRIAATTSYRSTQALGRDMREAGVQAFLFPSARDPKGGTNIGAFQPVFAHKQPTIDAGWLCHANRHSVEIVKKDFFLRESYAFERRTFEVQGKLPAPGSG